MILRALIVLLLCMNLGVAIWWASHSEPQIQALPATEPGIASLTLLSETEQLPTSEAAELSAAPEAPGPESVCLSLGPFSTPADMRKAMNTLMPQVESIQFREVAAVSLRGYRVFLPAAESRAQALEVARALAAQKVTDYYVVTAGERQNTVSLGVYNNLENATERHDQLAALGFTATIEPRTEPVQQWWIDLTAPAEFVWREALPTPPTGIDSAACSAPTASP